MAEAKLSEIDQRVEDAFAKLSPQQADFVRAHVENGGDGKAAADTAGYCPKSKGDKRNNSLKSTASRLLSKKTSPKICEAIAAMQAKANDLCMIDTHWWLLNTKKTFDKCSQAEEIMVFEGGEKVGTGEFRFDSAGATKCLDMIGKHLGVYAPAEVKHNVDDTLKSILEGMSGKTTGLPSGH